MINQDHMRRVICALPLDISESLPVSEIATYMDQSTTAAQLAIDELVKIDFVYLQCMRTPECDEPHYGLTCRGLQHRNRLRRQAMVEVARAS